MNLVGIIISFYHDAPSTERQISLLDSLISGYKAVPWRIARFMVKPDSLQYCTHTSTSVLMRWQN